MPAFLIVNYSVDNPELYGEYAAAAAAPLKFGDKSKLVALDAKTEQLEGEGAGHQTVIVRFESKDDAKEIYDSGDYQAIIGKRFAATSKHFAILVDGLPG